jgi:hypothetical protein
MAANAQRSFSITCEPSQLELIRWGAAVFEAPAAAVELRVFPISLGGMGEARSELELGEAPMALRAQGLVADESGLRRKMKCGRRKWHCSIPFCSVGRGNG